MQLRNLLRASLLAAAALSAAPMSFAYEPDRAFDELSGELAQCSAYYFLVARKLDGLPKEDSADYENLSLQARLHAMELTSPERTEEQVQMRLQDLVQKLDGDKENWALLTYQNHTLCGLLMEDPKPRLKYWMSKVDTDAPKQP